MLILTEEYMNDCASEPGGVHTEQAGDSPKGKKKQGINDGNGTESNGLPSLSRVLT